MKKKIIIVSIIIILVLLFWIFDLGRFFTLDYIKQTQAEFGDLFSRRPVLVVGGYFFIYVVVTALSLPGAAVMTLAGGALFGLLLGVAVVSFASTIGATLACLVSRYVLRDWVQNKFGSKLGAINEGIEREGAFYLFTLRLVPAFPFWLINLAMGLTPMPLRTFYWVSQVGMLAGTAVYVNAGKELGRIDSLSGILSPRLIISFVILGVFPLAVKKILGWYRARSGRTNGHIKGETE